MYANGRKRVKKTFNKFIKKRTIFQQKFNKSGQKLLKKIFFITIPYAFPANPVFAAIHSTADNLTKIPLIDHPERKFCQNFDGTM